MDLCDIGISSLMLESLLDFGGFRDFFSSNISLAMIFQKEKKSN